MQNILQEFSTYAFEGDSYNEIRALRLSMVSLSQFRIGPLSILLDLECRVAALPGQSPDKSAPFRLSIARHRVQDGAFPFSAPGDVEALGNIVLFSEIGRFGGGERIHTAFVEASTRAFIECRRLIRDVRGLEVMLRTYFPPRKPEPGVTVGAVLGLTLKKEERILCSVNMEAGRCVLAD